MVEIDGSYGEGGGQILRTALSLSCLTGKPFRIYNIRKGRKKPGLMPQHLTGVLAAKRISGAEVGGGSIGSTELSFTPGEVKGGEYSFDTGTAGSTLLVLQTILPALVSANEGTVITLRGGTHVPFSPSYHYIEGVFLPLLGRLGISVTLAIESYGFYPKGGGIIRAEIIPTGAEIIPLRNIERGTLYGIRGYSAVGNLPLSIAERQRKALIEKITAVVGDVVSPGNFELLAVPTPGQGTFVYLQAESENSVAGFTALGQRGKRAEAVGEETASDFLQYYATNA